MSQELNGCDLPATAMVCKLAKDKLMMFSYGEWEGFKKPSVPDLFALRGAIDGAIYELSNGKEELG